MATFSYTLDLPDEQRINFGNAQAVEYWTTALACTELELREAAANVGTRARDIRLHLQTSKNIAVQLVTLRHLRTQPAARLQAGRAKTEQLLRTQLPPATDQ